MSMLHYRLSSFTKSNFNALAFQSTRIQLSGLDLILSLPTASHYPINIVDSQMG